jgi:hypothetical protein
MSKMETKNYFVEGKHQNPKGPIPPTEIGIWYMPNSNNSQLLAIRSHTTAKFFVEQRYLSLVHFL